MKSYFTRLLCIAASVAMLASCSVRRINETDAGKDSPAVTEPKTDIQTAAAPEVTQPAETEAPAEDGEKALPIGIYDMTYCDFGVREEYTLQKDFQDDGALGRDLCVMAIFPSNENVLSGQYFLYIWQDAISKNPDAAGMKIGYFLEYSTPEGKYENVILRPSDITDKFWDYLEIYIYDDVNQDVNAWHSHLLDSEITDETLVTSFKLTAGAKIADVADIKLMAFLYSSDSDFDENGMYKGKNSYTVNIAWDKSRAS